MYIDIMDTRRIRSKWNFSCKTYISLQNIWTNCTFKNVYEGFNGQNEKESKKASVMSWEFYKEL